MLEFEYPKDPQTSSWYTFDWLNFLDAGEIITSVTHTVPTGITKVDESFTSTATGIKVSGGTNNESYEINCEITTPNNTYNRSALLKVKER